MITSVQNNPTLSRPYYAGRVKVKPYKRKGKLVRSHSRLQARRKKAILIAAPKKSMADYKFSNTIPQEAGLSVYGQVSGNNYSNTGNY